VAVVEVLVQLVELEHHQVSLEAAVQALLLQFLALKFFMVVAVAVAQTQEVVMAALLEVKVVLAVVAQELLELVLVQVLLLVIMVWLILVAVVLEGQHIQLAVLADQA
jgi:hypothetical protein